MDKFIYYSNLIKRYRENDPTLPVYAKVGDEIWNSGDSFDPISKVIVVADEAQYVNRTKYVLYSYANAYWNVLYFKEMEKAIHKNWLMHAMYAEWLYSGL